MFIGVLKFKYCCHFRDDHKMRDIIKHISCVTSVQMIKILNIDILISVSHDFLTFLHTSAYLEFFSFVCTIESQIKTTKK